MPGTTLQTTNVHRFTWTINAETVHMEFQVSDYAYQALND